MAERIVDHLEAVEVEEQHTDGPLVAGRPVEGVLESAEEERTVGKPGQVVVEGPLLELGRHLDALGHVPCIHDDALDRRVLEEVRGDDLHVPPSAVDVDDPGIEGRRHAGRRDDVGDLLEEPIQILGVDQVSDGDPFEVEWLESEDPGDCRAGVDDAPVGADDADHVGGVLDEGGQADLGGLDPLPGRIEVAEVAGHERDRLDALLGVPVCDQYGRDGQR